MKILFCLNKEYLSFLKFSHFYKIFNRFIPERNLLLTGFLPILAYVVLSCLLVAYLNKYKQVKVPYTRKIFHFLIFSFAGLLQYFYGLGAVTILGSVTSIIVLLAVYKGKGFAFFDSLARKTDEPHASKFILIPLLATASGGILSNLLVPSFAFIGYLVGGWGDAVAEPVGTRYGKHQYTVPTLFGVKATRSLEGSAAVFIVSVLLLFFTYLNFGLTIWFSVLYSIICAMIATLVEAFSSHGLDNLTIQVAVSLTSYYLLS